ncbi:MAG: tetratricopeptide repeat protein [Elusimicrobiota bacterium]|jgi:TolA-binding protein
MKKFVISVVLVIFGVGYIRSHYTFHDVVVYNQKHPDPRRSPQVAYYVGMTTFLRSDFPTATEAFTQLLTDYPTCQYAPKALLRLGTIYSEQQKWEDARIQFQRYIEEYPSGPDIETVKNKYEFIKFK